MRVRRTVKKNGEGIKDKKRDEKTRRRRKKEAKQNRPVNTPPTATSDNT